VSGLGAALIAAVIALRLRVPGPEMARAGAVALALAAVACAAICGIGLVRPYSTESFRLVTAPDVSIAGQILVPEGKGPFPAVVIVPGSDGSRPVTRDSQFGLYRANADLFARRGVVAAIYDSRGSGQSTGDRSTILLEDRARDAAAVARWLADQPGVDASRTGFWGISNGGWVAPLAARLLRSPTFLILVSAPATSEGLQRQYEWAAQLDARGVAASDIQELLQTRWQIWSYLATGEHYDDARSAYDAATQRTWWRHLDAVIHPRWLNRSYVEDSSSHDDLAWFREDMRRDPVGVLEQVSARTLAIYGADDAVIPVAEAIERMRRAADAFRMPMEVRVCERCGHPLLELGIPPRFPRWYADAMIGLIES